MKKLSLLLLMVIPFFAFSQTCYTCANSYCPVEASVVSIADYNSRFAASTGINFSVNSENQKVLGDFEKVKITLNGDVKNVLGRYNAITNEIEIKYDDGKIYNLRRFADLSISLTNSNKNYKSFLYVNKDGQEMVDFFELTDNQNQILLSQTNLQYVEGKKAKTGYDNSKPAYYKENKMFFFIDSNKSLVRVTTNKREIKNLYPSYSKEMLAFIKSNRLKDSPQDFAKLAKYMKMVQLNQMKQGELASNK